ncbi:hypothetical protein BOTBODRAFT_91795, partial [Botryobasidium botryosum FD-172 SS1]
TDIFTCIAPNLLHQIHKGVFKTHLLEWCQSILSESEMDRRFHAMSHHPTLRHFRDGISGLKQWSGTKAKHVERVFVSVIAGAVQGKLMIATRALMDFMMVAQYLEHSDATLAFMDEKLADFHRNKQGFVDVRACKQPEFNIPKLHSLQHYTEFIKLLGALDGYNSESLECLHINCAKKAYHASNKKDYALQMMQWLTRQEAMYIFQSYL